MRTTEPVGAAAGPEPERTATAIAAPATASTRDGRQRRREPAPGALRLVQPERAASVVDELAAGLVAVLRLLGQCAGDHCVDLGRQLPDPLAGLGRRLLEVREDDGDVGVAHERHLTREALEQEASERVHVGARIDRIASHLLGSDVRERAEQALRDVDRRRSLDVVVMPKSAR